MADHATLRSDLIVSKSILDNEPRVVIKEPTSGRFIMVREPEFWLMEQLDGASSPTDVASRFSEKYGFAMKAADVEGFITSLDDLGFLEGEKAEKLRLQSLTTIHTPKTLFGKLLYIKLKAFSPGKLLDKLSAQYRRWHNPWLWTVQTALILLALYIIWQHPETFAAFDPTELFTVGSILAIVVSLFIIIVFHEYAHALVCRYYGGHVREMGFLLMYFQPCFYCDVSDAWLFSNKSQRLAVSFAGPWYQLVLTALAVIVWRMTVPGTFVSEVARIIALVSIVSYFFNFNPLIKLDGYYLLSDWLGIPNLRTRAFAYFGNALKRRLLGWEIERVEATPRYRKIFLTYAILAIIYTSLLVGFVLYLLASWLLESYGGVGLLLLAVVLVIILRQNFLALGRGVLTHLKEMKRLTSKPLRLTVYIIVTVIIVGGVFFVPVPDRVSGEIIVRPIAEFQIIMNEIGLIERSFRKGGQSPEHKVSILQINSSEMGVLDLLPTVADGQLVMKNDTVAMLASNQTTQEIEEAEAELQRLEGTLALLRAPPKREEILEAESRATAAKANFDKKKSDFERAEGLANKNMISTQELENARSAMDIALAEWRTEQSAIDLLKSPPRPEEETVLVREIQKQRARLSFLRSQVEAQVILAPFNGVVARNASDKAVVAVIDDRMIELLVPVNDFDITRVELKQLVTVKVRSYPGEIFKGLVVRIPETASEIDGKQRFEVAVLVNNDSNLLRDGMTGYAKIEIGDTSIAGLLYQAILSRVRVEFWSWW